MSGISTTPDTIEMASTETRTVSVAFTAELGAATIASVTVTLTNIETGAAHAAGLGAKSNTLTTVFQKLTALVAGAKYRLVITITDTAGEVTASETIVSCPF